MARHQRTRVKHIDALLNPEEVQALLSKLCIKLGFCLPPVEIERLAASPLRDIDEFTQAIFVAEGFGVVRSDGLFDQVREVVTQAFIDHQSRTTL